MASASFRVTGSKLLSRMGSCTATRTINTPLNHAIMPTTRQMSTGARGSRGHGWLVKYRTGKGGRHLQGRYYKDRTPEAIAQKHALNDKIFDLNNTTQKDDDSSIPSEVYFDILTEGWSDPKRVTIELASAALPVTCQNFVKLCSSGKARGLTTEDNNQDGVESTPVVENADDFNLGYESSVVHKIEKNVGVCLGDILMERGSGGRCHPSVVSLPGNGHTFADEGHIISHGVEGGGIVSMLSSGVDLNDSRFIITTNHLNQLDGRCVAFGRVKGGMEVIKELTTVFTKRGVPASEIRVVKCGVV